jgi:hypothetical protein
MGLEAEEDQLNLRVLMRSNDAILGLPYDVFAFSQFHCTLARTLSLKIGTYTHETWSLHLYDRDWEAGKVHPPNIDTPFLAGVGLEGEAYGSVQLAAFWLLHGDLFTSRELTTSERWFAKQLDPLFEARRAED